MHHSVLIAAASNSPKSNGVASGMAASQLRMNVGPHVRPIHSANNASASSITGPVRWLLFASAGLKSVVGGNNLDGEKPAFIAFIFTRLPAAG